MDEKEVVEVLSSITIEELYEIIKKILFQKKYRKLNTLKLKIMILKELKRRGKLIVKLTQEHGPPYLTSTKELEELNDEQANATLHYCQYTKDLVECIIDAPSKKIQFLIA